MALPRELATAIADAHDRELGEGDAVRRARQLAVLRATLDAWVRGVVSTEHAVQALREIGPS